MPAQPTKNIGRKFNSDGSVRFFPGNTVICKIKMKHPAFPPLTQALNGFSAMHCAQSYAFLPPASLHMTIIQGVCDEDRQPALFTSKLPLDAPLEAVDALFEKQFKSVAPLGETWMRFSCVDIGNDIIIVRFMPETAKDAENLKAYRNDVSDHLGLRFPDHDSYGFHVSLGYKLFALSNAQAAETTQVKTQIEAMLAQALPRFQLPQPEMTYFYNMFCFQSNRIVR